MKDYKFLCEKYGAFLSEDEEYYFSFRKAICEHLLNLLIYISTNTINTRCPMDGSNELYTIK